MPDGQVLEFTHVTKRFGEVTAVSDFSARVEPGVVTAFLGPNGAGKTTSLRILLGQIRATSGTATIGGTPYPDLRHPLRTIGAVLEETAYRPRRTALRQLTMAAKANGIPLSRVSEVLALVGLAGEEETRIGAYSLGMRQRLSVATALLGDPGALVFDEPANGLDPEGIRWMRLLMRRLADEGRTVLVSSHVLSEVEQVADDVLVLSKGELVLASGIEKLADPAGGSVVVDADDRAALTAALSHAGLDFEVLRSGLTVRGEDAAKVGAVAAASGVALTTLLQRGPTLEDVFITLVRGGTLEPRVKDAAERLVSPDLSGTAAAAVPAASVVVSALSADGGADADVESESEAVVDDVAVESEAVADPETVSVEADTVAVEDAAAEGVDAHDVTADDAEADDVPADAGLPVDEAADAADASDEAAEVIAGDDVITDETAAETVEEATADESTPDESTADESATDGSAVEADGEESSAEAAEDETAVEETPAPKAAGLSFDEILFGAAGAGAAGAGAAGAAFANADDEDTEEPESDVLDDLFTEANSDEENVDAESADTADEHPQDETPLDDETRILPVIREEDAASEDAASEEIASEETASEESSVDSEDASESGADADADTDTDTDEPEGETETPPGDTAADESASGVEFFDSLGNSDSDAAEQSENEQPKSDDEGETVAPVESQDVSDSDADPRTEAVSSMIAAAARAYFEDEPKDYPFAKPEESDGQPHWSIAGSGVIDTVPLEASASDDSSEDGSEESADEPSDGESTEGVEAEDEGQEQHEDEQPSEENQHDEHHHG